MNTTLHQLTKEYPKFKPLFKVGDLVKYTCELFKTAPEWEKLKNLVGVVLDPVPNKENLIQVLFSDASKPRITLQSYLSLVYRGEPKDD